MYQKFILLISVFVLSSVSVSQALVVGDFEGGLDGWASAGDATLTPVAVGVTSGAESLLIEGPGSWQMLALLDIKAVHEQYYVDSSIRTFFNLAQYFFGWLRVRCYHLHLKDARAGIGAFEQWISPKTSQRDY